MPLHRTRAAGPLAILAAAACLGCSPPDRQRPAREVRAAVPQSPQIFTPAHRDLADAVREFFDIRPSPVQPIAFTHKVHVDNKLGCTDYCHTAAALGPVAGLPGVKTCMICHATIATDRQEIKKVAAYLDRGEDISWQRVYGFRRSAHVRFNHAPHLGAGIDCAACHGDTARQAVATRGVAHTMGFCVSCHRARRAPIDCLTCHF